MVGIGYDTLGVADSTAALVVTDLEQSIAEAVIAAVSRSVRKRSPFPAPPGPGQAQENRWSVLVRLDLGPSATMRVGRTETCPPVLVNRRAVTAAISREYGALMRRTPSLPDTIRIDMLLYIDTTGVVTKANAKRSSGRFEVDGLAHSVALQAQFLPALHNRKPMSVVVEIPFTLRVETEPPPEEELSRCVPSVAGRRCPPS